MADVSLGEAQAGTSVEAKVGDRVVVALEETPTSGFRWELDGFDRKVLDFESSEFVPADPSHLGGGGTREVTFRIKQPGSTHVVLKLWRAWVGEASVARRFDAEVLARQ